MEVVKMHALKNFFIKNHKCLCLSTGGNEKKKKSKSFWGYFNKKPGHFNKKPGHFNEETGSF